MVKIEDLLFWIFILIILITALWLLSGSPPEMSAIITIGLAVIGSELMLWKKLFSVEKNTTISFVKVKYEFEKLRNEMNQQFSEIKNLIRK